MVATKQLLTLVLTLLPITPMTTGQIPMDMCLAGCKAASFACLAAGGAGATATTVAFGAVAPAVVGGCFMATQACYASCGAANIFVSM